MAVGVLILLSSSFGVVFVEDARLRARVKRFCLYICFVLGEGFFF